MKRIKEKIQHIRAVQWRATDAKLSYGLEKNGLVRLGSQAAVPDMAEDEDGEIRVRRKSIILI